MNGLSVKPAVVQVLHRLLCVFLVTELPVNRERERERDREGKGEEEREDMTKNKVEKRVLQCVCVWFRVPVGVKYVP